MAALAGSEEVVRALRVALGAECIETHISWVLLAGDEAYKLKKPLKLDFLDFSTLALRRAACEEELRINRRTAPGLYLGVVPVTGSPAAPRLGGDGPAIDYAVHMRRFDRAAELAQMAREGRLRAEHVDALARQVAALHARAAVAPADGPHGQPELIRRTVADNLPPLQTRLRGGELAALPDELAQWTHACGERLAPVFARRLREGQVRECHGDLHLGNLLWLDGDAVLFDALEFDPALRWIDVVADVAFLFMDLHAADQAGLAWRFINAWLELTGDHAGLAVLPYYAAYRALVRAKVASLRVHAEGDAHWHDMLRYLRLAGQLAQPRACVLYLASGVSGSGKSSQSQPLIEQQGIVRLRADVERKRLFGLAPAASSAGVPGGIYTPEASGRTYAQLRERARQVLAAGFAVLVDATFLRQAHRAEFIALAAQCGVPCRLLVFDAPVELLRERVRRRAAEGGDASEATVAVLERQLVEREPLSEAEQALAIHVDTTQAVDWTRLAGALPSGSVPG